MKHRHRHNSRLLFIIKRRESPYEGEYSSKTLESGLSNSVRFVEEMLLDNGVEAHMIEVADNNGIDAAVAAFRPTVCVIEAFWVVPSKFEELARLHPTVTWVVRGHSELPFLASEGIAIEWLIEYARHPNVMLAANTPSSHQDIVAILRAAYPAVSDVSLESKVLYLPNYYPQPFAVLDRKAQGHVVQVGCFGAVRYLKNHLIQGVAALRLSETIRKPVHFHINATRIEGQAANVLKNLRALFARAPYAKLVEHEWMPRDRFLEVMKGMDISMQVSLSETFNIVTADAVACGVPVVVSPEIYWLDQRFWVSPTDSRDILQGLERALAAGQPEIAHQNRCLLAYSSRVTQQWLDQVL